MSPREFRLALCLVALGVALLSLGALVAMHERHYSKRRLILLTKRVDAIEALVTGDHSV